MNNGKFVAFTLGCKQIYLIWLFLQRNCLHVGKNSPIFTYINIKHIDSLEVNLRSSSGNFPAKEYLPYG